MPIEIKRVYDLPKKDDGYRVLVDRLWPRGLTTEKAQIDEWPKDIAPTKNLRKWFHKNESKWDEFQKEYQAFFSENKEKIESLIKRSRRQKVNLLFASKRLQLNNASVLKDYIENNLGSSGE